MEPKFKTSFIPKQSLQQEALAPHQRFSSGGGHGVFFIVSFVLFLISLLGAGGVFFYSKYLESSIASKQEQLSLARAAFEPDTIEALSRVDSRIEAAKRILDAHIAPSVLFALLEQTTLRSVRFNSFTYTDSPSGVMIELEGEARDFNGLALQSDVFGSNRVLRNPVVRNFDLTDTRDVTFSVSAQVDPAFIAFHTDGATASVESKLAAPELELEGGTKNRAVGESILSEPVSPVGTASTTTAKTNTVGDNVASVEGGETKASILPPPPPPLP